MLKLAWKNLWRNRNRTLITVAAIFFAVILSVFTSSLWQGVFENLVRNLVSFHSGYIQIHRQGYWNEQILDNSFELTEDTRRRVLQEKNVSAFSPRLESFALASSKDITKGCLVIGIDPEMENRITHFKDKITGGYLERSGRGVLLGSGLADRLRLKLNDTVVIIGQGFQGTTAAGKYPVSGIWKMGSPALNDKVLYMSLAQAQEFSGAENRITACVLALTNPARLSETAQRLRSSLGGQYEVMTWEEMMPDIKQHMRTDLANMKIIQAILYILISFGILATLIMMMVERKFEISMLVAVGMTKARLIGLLVMESLFTVLIGCGLGLVCSIPIVIYLKENPLRFSGRFAEVYERFGFEAVWPTSTEPGIFFTQGMIVFFLGLLMSLYPVYKALVLEPVNALKR